jgi:hypothetical protein
MTVQPLGATARRVILRTKAASALALSLCLTAGVAFSSQDREQARQSRGPVAEQAMLALADLLVEAKGYEDESLKVRVKTQVADVLWPHEADRARGLIEDAFAEAAGLKDYPGARLDLTSEIIRIATRHEPDLATRLITRRKQDSEDGPARVRRSSFDRITERGLLYLESASTLLKDDQAKAVALARRSISEGRSDRFFQFLNQLKHRDEAAAEKLFLEALAALGGGAADPNDVLLFGMALFYPNRRSASSIGTDANGIEIFASGLDFSAAPAPPPALLKAYLLVAADQLVLFPTPQGQVGAIELKRYALHKLLPVYEQYMPGQVAAIQEQLRSLGPAAAWAPSPLEARGLRPASAIADDLSTSEVIALAEKLPDAAERDRRLFDVATRTIDQGDFEKARAVAARISFADLREPLLEMIAYRDAKRALAGNELEEAERLANSQLTEERRAVIHFELSRQWLGRGDYVRASQHINAAAVEAARTDDRAQRARLYVYLTDGLARHDAPRAFEMVEMAVKDINAAEKFNPAGESLLFVFPMPGGGSSSYGFGQHGSLVSALGMLARSDLYRTINVARSLVAPWARSAGVIAACRSVLATPRRPVEKKAEPARKKADKKAVAGRY